MSEYEAYWLTDFPLMIYDREKIWFGLNKVNKKEKKISNFIVDRHHSYKK